MKTILWGIVIVFIGGIFFWQYTSRNFTTAAAEVNGQKIPYESFRKTLYQRIEEWRDKNPGKDMGDEEMKSIKEEVLGYLILQEILSQEAKHYGLRVTENELINTIRSLPQFQKEGQFHPQLYAQTLLYSYRTTPEEYEKRIKNLLLTEKLKRLVSGSLKITSQEMENEYARRNVKESENPEEQVKFIQTVFESKRTEFYQQWIRSIYHTAKIVSNLEKIEKGPYR